MNFAALLTWYSVAPHSCIFTVITVVDSNTIMCAVSQACLSSIADHIVIVDWTTACTKVGFSQSRYGSAVIELLADHIGISDVPFIITHSTPCVVVVNLNTSFAVGGTSHQSNRAICLMWEQQQYYSRMPKVSVESEAHQWHFLYIEIQCASMATTVLTHAVEYVCHRGSIHGQEEFHEGTQSAYNITNILLGMMKWHEFEDEH